MYKYILLAFLSSPVQADVYFELGVGTIISTQEEMLPEIDLQGPLGKFVFGIEAKNGWSVEYEHISSIPDDEEGKGLNVMWFSKRVYF